VNPPIVLQFDGVSVASPIEGSPSVAGIDWQVLEGQCWVIGGLQGSGKSAVIEAAAGLRALSSGGIQLFGIDPTQRTGTEAQSLRRRVGLVFEGSGRLFGGLSVLENLTLPLRYHEDLSPEDALNQILPLLEAFDLQPVAGLLPRQLGFGFSKRVALARALVLRPEILLVDDPLGGLDAAQSRTLRRLLMQLNQGHPWLSHRPVTLIITAEELRPFLNLGGHFALVENRRWTSIGTRDDLLECRTTGVLELLADHSEHPPS